MALVTGLNIVNTHKDYDDKGDVNAGIIKASYDHSIGLVTVNQSGYTKRDHEIPSTGLGRQSYARAKFNPPAWSGLASSAAVTLVGVSFYTDDYRRAASTLGSGTVQMQNLAVSGLTSNWTNLASPRAEHTIGSQLVTGSSTALKNTVKRAAVSGVTVNVRWSVPDPGAGKHRYWSIRSTEFGKTGPPDEKDHNVVAAGFQPKLRITIA